MVYRGHVENGAIRLNDAPVLPDGAEVEVRLLAAQAPNDDRKIPSLYERLKGFVGKADGLPPDLSINHDHYLYGLPKRQ